MLSSADCVGSHLASRLQVMSAKSSTIATVLCHCLHTFPFACLLSLVVVLVDDHFAINSRLTVCGTLRGNLTLTLTCRWPLLVTMGMRRADWRINANDKRERENTYCLLGLAGTRRGD